MLEQLGAKPFIAPVLTPEAADDLLSGCDACIHFIGITGGSASQFEQINVGSARVILNAAIRQGLSRIVTPSGLGVDQYGLSWWATNPYFLSKMHLEELFRVTQQPFVIFRPTYILGPGDELIPYMVKCLQRGVYQIPGEGTSPMQPIFVEDVANAMLNAAEGRGPSNTIYDLVGPSIVNLRQLVAMVEESMTRIFDFRGSYTIESVPLENAPEVLGLSNEDIGVSQCDLLGNPEPMIRNLGIRLTPLQDAIDAAVTAAYKKKAD
jgi:NADH dehydrogenase